eukprot:TRINITY_DN30305_c0_g1_i1.p1 TRINITY_DN30305_c0_g1~~TRINITY_DN30305_c0_g1_i1.p1  ORF type:complete len:520 (+),score=78.09 TRINITY_DN30305_c0_g1_i1:56-1615(+)
MMCLQGSIIGLALLAACRWTAAHGLHMVFVLPPVSPKGAMLPVACGALEAGHNVTLLAYENDASKLRTVIHGAHIVSLGASQRPHIDDKKMQHLMNLPYEAIPFFTNFFLSAADFILGKPLAMAALPEIRRLKPDVLCVVNILPSGYALGELLDIPVVGLGFATPFIFQNLLETPWSLEPSVGNWYTRKEIKSHPALLILNTIARLHGFAVRGIGSIANNVMRLQLGLSRLELSQHESILAHPSIVPVLPELTAGYPQLMPTNVVMAGLYDHPMLGGMSLGKSDQHDEIISWLDRYSTKKVPVLYCAFGSEVAVDLALAEKLLESFGSIPVLWVLRKTPPGLSTPPSNVFITPWSLQKAVLAHQAVKVFLSHGGGNSVREAVAAGVPLLIMPFVGDQPTNAVIHEELGVAIRVHKGKFTPKSLEADYVRISSEKYQRRSAEIKELNDKHVSISRAVEVIVDAGNRRFPMHHPQEHALLSCIPIVTIFAALLGIRMCCRCCCSCCLRRTRQTYGSKTKSD